MASSQVSNEDFEEVVNRLKRYEEAFGSVKDRLVAFERLESIARERQSTPEVVAAKAATVLLERKLSGLLDEVSALAEQRDSTRGELEMLLLNKKETARETEEARLRTDGEAEHTAISLNDLDIIREDGRQLRVERKKLLKQLGELRNEISLLEDKRVSLFNELGRRSDDDAPVKTKIHLGEGSLMTANRAGDAQKLNEESEAFDRFFSTNIEDDKARDWILK